MVTCTFLVPRSLLFENQNARNIAPLIGSIGWGQGRLLGVVQRRRHSRISEASTTVPVTVPQPQSGCSTRCWMRSFAQFLRQPEIFELLHALLNGRHHCSNPDSADQNRRIVRDRRPAGQLHCTGTWRSSVYGGIQYIGSMPLDNPVTFDLSAATYVSIIGSAITDNREGQRRRDNHPGPHHPPPAATYLVAGTKSETATASRGPSTLQTNTV